MWRNLVSTRNWLSINQTAQCLKRSTSLSFSFSFSPPVSLNQTAAPYYCAANRRQSEKESDTLIASRQSLKRSIDFPEAMMAKQSEVLLSFAKHVFLKKANKNVVVSPLSIQAVLSLIATGSKGSTRQQLLSFLKANSVDDLTSFASRLSDVIFADDGGGCGPCLSFANGLWFDKPLILKPSFKQIVDSHFKATVADQVDFWNEAAQVAKEINFWVEKNTGGLINNIVDEYSLKELARLVFVNALYFKGTWLEEFDSSKTKDYEFHLLCGNSSVKAPFMTSDQKEHYIKVCDGFKVLGLPYNSGDDFKRSFKMYIFLPDSNDGLPSLVEKVDSQSNFLEQQLPKTPVEVGDFRIPKFKISSTVEASDVLTELGLTLPFSTKEAELTEMAYPIVGEPLYVSSIFQKAFIEVDEKGTEATAATYTCLGAGCVPDFKPPPKIDFVADHPFLFLIREDESGAVLFVGQVFNPLEH